ncbi:hypothetical protein RRG08_061948 [Elysia crispata]|uniref:Uncharacterized protein n=1 Tax=Elysia crispata TaxID=231223 RepID=A0AAE0ZJB6_9GAST|nr:hypothetical protein RRG08_061948 [Elysia crispata]
MYRWRKSSAVSAVASKRNMFITRQPTAICRLAFLVHLRLQQVQSIFAQVVCRNLTAFCSARVSYSSDLLGFQLEVDLASDPCRETNLATT